VRLDLWRGVALAHVHPTSDYSPEKLQRVAPPGSTFRTAVALCGVRRYTIHGGGPADGALYSAVSARPVGEVMGGEAQRAARVAGEVLPFARALTRLEPEGTVKSSSGSP
jgi:hypothetical protein